MVRDTLVLPPRSTVLTEHLRRHRIDLDDACLVGRAVLDGDESGSGALDIALRPGVRDDLLAGMAHRQRGDLRPVALAPDVRLIVDRYATVGVDDGLLFADTVLHARTAAGVRAARPELELSHLIAAKRQRADELTALIDEHLRSDDWTWEAFRDASRTKAPPRGLRRRLGAIRAAGRSFVYKHAQVMRASLRYRPSPDTPRVFTIILWPPLAGLLDEATAFVAERYQIVTRRDLLLDDDAFRSFAYDVYEPDGLLSWKLERKLYMMRPFEKRTRFLQIVIPVPRFRMKGDHVLSLAGAALKGAIRQTFGPRLERYVFDIVVHTGDNYERSADIAAVVARFASIAGGGRPVATSGATDIVRWVGGAREHPGWAVSPERR